MVGEVGNKTNFSLVIASLLCLRLLTDYSKFQIFARFPNHKDFLHNQLFGIPAVLVGFLVVDFRGPIFVSLVLKLVSGLPVLYTQSSGLPVLYSQFHNPALNMVQLDHSGR